VTKWSAIVWANVASRSVAKIWKSTLGTFDVGKSTAYNVESTKYTATWLTWRVYAESVTSSNTCYAEPSTNTEYPM